MHALGEVGQAVSSTLDLQTVLVTIITHAVELSKADAGGTIYEFDEAADVFEPRANYRVSDAYVRILRESRIRIGESAVGRCAVNRAPYQVPDVERAKTVACAIRCCARAYARCWRCRCCARSGSLARW